MIGQACAIGDARSYISMILVLEPDLAQAWARQRGLAALTLAELANSAEVRAVTDAAVTRVNARLAPAERIRAYVVVGDLWLPDSDLSTPTAKMKRRAVHARYVAEIEWLYSDGGINLCPTRFTAAPSPELLTSDDLRTQCRGELGAPPEHRGQHATSPQVAVEWMFPGEADTTENLLTVQVCGVDCRAGE